MNPTNVPYQLLEEITDGFSDERKLGKGGYGTVYKGEYKNGDKIAVKILHMEGFNDKKFNDEFGNLMIANHPNIVQLVGYCYDVTYTTGPAKGRPALIATIHRALCFEYMPRGSLENYLSDEDDGLDWPIRYKIIKGTCEGLKHLHVEVKPPIYHLDLKPANILLDNNMVPKIADFGLSRFISEEKTMTTETLVGTIPYMPREYIERKEISNKLDIFSLGAVMLEIIAGPTGRFRSTQMPSQEFTDQVQGNWKNRLQTRRNGPLLEAYCQQVKTCTEIALKCLEIDRKNRPNILEIINQINEKEATIGELPIDHALEKLPSHNESTLDSKLASHLNLNETKGNQEPDHHNSSCSKEKEEDQEEDQIIPMEYPDVPIDVHPSEPWYKFRLVTAAKFIARKQWFVVGHHDGFIRVYTYESPVKQVKRFKAHTWNITTLDVHPTEPYLLSVGSQDQIKLWDWNKGWECIKTFDLHGLAYQIKFNPKDTHKFAIAGLKDAQVWNIRSSRHEFTLSGHGYIVSSFDYFTRGNQLYMITGSWDKTAKIWDCQRRTCVQTLEGHTDCITCVCSHPDLPILLTGSDDETVRLWNSITFKLEGVLDFELGKVTAIVCLKGSKRVVIGHDAGLVITEIRHEKPGPSNR
uniref:Protein kinase domain-containing protein n=1 Tax=Oryza punctata TaxID=4537 RepID=A0A0E0MDU0_ORYPU